MSKFASKLGKNRLDHGPDCKTESHRRASFEKTYQNKILVLITISSIILGYSAVQAAERLELEDTNIQGAKELPKVLYIVPWKDSQLGSLGSIAGEGSFESTMVPLDRYTFRREIKYHLLLQGEDKLTSP